MTTTEQLAKAQAELAASREYTRQLYIQVADLQAGLVREDKFPTITGEHWKESLERAKATANGISEQIRSMSRPEAAPASPIEPMKTRIYKTQKEFFARSDKKENGISESHAALYPEWEKQNATNESCYNCSGCSDCYNCSGLRNTKPEPKEKAESWFQVPTIANLHQTVFAAASKPDALYMGDWHTCETTHCRAGWIVFLAGEKGKALEKSSSTLFAAMQIAKASSPIKISPVRFFDKNDVAMADMQRCAEEEAKL